MRILGVDPGSRITGFGIIETNKKGHQYITSGCIRLKSSAAYENLRQIHEGLIEIIDRYQPTIAVVERIFFSTNASSALKLGQARGAALVAAANKGLLISEYTARQIKQAVVGYGAAEKNQIQQMVAILLKLSGKPQVDAADALAAAICHANSSFT
jgi:crossover junction endodeoxyribonuclease RuvC